MTDIVYDTYKLYSSSKDLFVLVLLLCGNSLTDDVEYIFIAVSCFGFLF